MTHETAKKRTQECGWSRSPNIKADCKSNAGCSHFVHKALETSRAFPKSGVPCLGEPIVRIKGPKALGPIVGSPHFDVLKRNP